MRCFKHLFFLLTFIGGAMVLKANTGEKGNKKASEGTVHGYVVDAATRKPVSGVIVSASSSKIQGEKEIQSDASGYFNFGKLPAGDVTLMFEKKGYKLYKRDALSLKQGTTVKLAVEVESTEDDNNDIWHPLFKLLNDQ